MKKILDCIFLFILAMALIGGFNFTILASGLPISLLSSKIVSCIIVGWTVYYTIRRTK